MQYRCIGDVRGWCKHTHRSLRAACECCERDERGCARQGGYSDRYPLVWDAPFYRPLSNDDADFVLAHFAGELK